MRRHLALSPLDWPRLELPTAQRLSAEVFHQLLVPDRGGWSNCDLLEGRLLHHWEMENRFVEQVVRLDEAVHSQIGDLEGLPLLLLERGPLGQSLCKLLVVHLSSFRGLDGSGIAPLQP